MLEGVLGVLNLLIMTGVLGVGEEYSGRAVTARFLCISNCLSSFFIAASWITEDIEAAATVNIKFYLLTF